MALSLGEKLRQAREARGISISEIAEQTRISPHYLKGIEDNDFKLLPGGIFNKGFIKSFARYVGVDEAEAVQDYILALGGPEEGQPDEPKAYHPEVLTDDRAKPSFLPTILFAALILGLMSVGVWLIASYLRSPAVPSNTAVANNALSNTVANTAQANSDQRPVSDKINVDLKASGTDIWIRTIVDGSTKDQTLKAEETVKVEANDSVKLVYAKEQLSNLQIAVNGHPITVPAPAKGKVELTIDRSNLAQFTGGAAASTPAQTPIATPVQVPTAEANPTPSVTPSEVKRTPTPVKHETPKPTASATPKPIASPTTIIIGPKTTPKPAATKPEN